MKKPRVLFAPRNIASQPSEWQAGLAALGVESEVWSFGEPAFGMKVDRVLDQDLLLASPDYRWRTLADAVERFDVFHFQYGRSLLNPKEPVLPPLWDLPLLRSLDKRVYMHWHGSDVRLPSVHRAREPHSYLRDANVDEPAILAAVAVARHYADAMFASTAGLLDYVPDAELVPLALDPAEWAVRRPAGEPPVPVVVHLPSRRSTKGSDTVDAALAGLHADGVIVYRPLSGIPRDEVRAEFGRADMVVDSLTIGDHGLVSVEAMASGAIALAHVHERVRERSRMPGSPIEDCPIVEVTGETLAAEVRRLAGDPAERARLRKVGPEWVAQRHDRAVIAQQLLTAYRRPRRSISAPYPAWPQSVGRSRVAALEAEVDRLRTVLGANGLAVDSAPPLTSRERMEARPGLHLAVRRVRRWLG